MLYFCKEVNDKYMSDKVKVEKIKQYIRAEIQTSSFNEDDYTVEVIAATDAPVLMRDWDGFFYEVLSMADGHVMKDRMEGGLSVLDNHDRYGGNKSLFGRSISCEVKGNQIVAVLKLSRKDEAKGFVQDVKDGIAKDISLGYRVYSYIEEDGVGTDIPTRTATLWEPMEISFAPVPADHRAKTRSANDSARDADNFYEVNISKTNTMSDKKGKENEQGTEQTRAAGTQGTEGKEQGTEQTRSTEGTPTPDKTPATQPTDEGRGAGNQKDLVKSERQRSSEILAACRKANLPAEFAQELIDSDKTLDQARAAIIDKFADNDTNSGMRHQAKAGEDHERQGFVQAATDALALRSGGAIAKEVTDSKDENRIRAAKRYSSNSLMEIAKDCLRRAGEDYDGLSKMEVAGRATSSTSDFPILLGGIIHQTLLAEYQAVPDTWRRFCSTGTIADFRPHSRIRTGSLSNLDEVNENGEFKTKKITDGDKETIQGKTKGNIINVSRQMIINDDLGAFLRLTGMLSRAAARSIEADVYALLNSNAGLGPLMNDGKTLFHADHGNLLTGGSAAANTVASWETVMNTMAAQKDKDGNDFLDIEPELWLGHTSKYGTATVVNNAEFDVDSSKFQVPNRSRGMAKDMIKSQRLASAIAWYFFANPNLFPTLEVAFLDGITTPYTDTRPGFTVDGMQWKIRHDWAVGAVGYQGAVLNTGA